MPARIADEPGEDRLAAAAVTLGDLVDRQPLDDERAERRKFGTGETSRRDELREPFFAITGGRGVALAGRLVEACRVEKPDAIARAVPDGAALPPAVIRDGQTVDERTFGG